jgi:hypothetical protein
VHPKRGSRRIYLSAWRDISPVTALEVETLHNPTPYTPGWTKDTRIAEMRIIDDLSRQGT